MIPELPSFVRNAHLWIPGYLRAESQKRKLPPPKTVSVMIGDHYEPYWGKADHSTARTRVEQWCCKWPAIARQYRDSLGHSPRYTFFYAEEDYHPELLDMLAPMVEEGIADIEVHLHHDHESEADFVERMGKFLETLHIRHGFLRKMEGKITFAFIHGNWALDNSRPDGKWCGLNNELTLLRDLGCYADFTLPSAPHQTQTRMVNTIYWAVDDPARPRSHDRGREVSAGCWPQGDLLIVPGPLGWNFRGGRKLPRLECGELASYDGIEPGRVNSWLELAPRVGSDVFVKLFTHGTQEHNLSALLDRDLARLFDDFAEVTQTFGLSLQYVSAWEMRRAIGAAATLDFDASEGAVARTRVNSFKSNTRFTAF